MVEWPHFSHLEGKEASLGHSMCLNSFFHFAAHRLWTARDRQQYVLSLLLPLSTGERGGGGFLKLLRIHGGRTSSPTTI